MTAAASIGALPHALRDGEELSRRFAGRRPAVFLDYDGTCAAFVLDSIEEVEQFLDTLDR